MHLVIDEIANMADTVHEMVAKLLYVSLAVVFLRS